MRSDYFHTIFDIFGGFGEKKTRINEIEKKKLRNPNTV
jgi:hypothetical protein